RAYAVAIERVVLDLEPRGLGLAPRVLDAALEIELLLGRTHGGGRARGERGDRVDVGRVTGLELQRERRLVLAQRAVEREREPVRGLRPARGRERGTRRPGPVAQAAAHRRPPRAEAGLGHDLDAGMAALVVFGGEAIGLDADLADLALGRQAAAAEAVDAEHRPR